MAPPPANYTLALPCCPTCWVPTCLLGLSNNLPSFLSLPWFSCLGEADSPEVSLLHSWFPLGPSAKCLSASLRLTVFSNPEQTRRCGQGRETRHQFSSERPWERGAPEIRQPLRPSGLCGPWLTRSSLPGHHRCLRPPPALPMLLVAAQLGLV